MVQHGQAKDDNDQHLLFQFHGKRFKYFRLNSAPSSSVERHFLLEEQEPEGYTDHQTGMMFINDKYVPE